MLFAAALLWAASLPSPAPAAAQGSRAGDGFRFGITFGGVGTVGIVAEYFDGTHAVDLTVATWSFRDLSISATVREYFGAAALRPVVGAGLWLVVAPPGPGGATAEDGAGGVEGGGDEGRGVLPGGRTGVALVLRVPVGVDWHAGGDHYLGAQLNVDRALWVRRTDPLDDTPLNERLVPLPEVYYRWSR